MTRAPRASAGHDRPIVSASPTLAASSSATALPLQATASNRSRDERPPLSRERLPSIRLRRRSSSTSLRGRRGSAEDIPAERDYPHGISQPRPVAQPPPNVNARTRRTPQAALPRLTEEGPRPTVTELGVGYEDAPPPLTPPRPRRRRLSRLLHRESRDEDEEYHDDLVDFLDIIDPEIQALSTLTNVQNSLFVPDLGNLINRRPAYSLSQYVPDAVVAPPRDEPSRPDLQLDRIPTARDEPPPADSSEESKELPSLQRTSTITSRLSESHYAALPHGTKLDGWTESEKWELDDHVRHMLHSRRSRFKRTMKGFGQYVRRPLGFFVTLYAVLITLFGLAWVLFLIGWIYVGDHQVYAIHIIDSVLVALFAIMGDGLAPFRAVDTYHMAFIVHYSRKLAAARRKLNPEAAPAESRITDAADADDDAISVERIMASTAGVGGNTDPESGRKQMDADTHADAQQDEELLSPKQMQRLRHHQKKLAKSHSFYKPHETFTHNPFPLSFLIAVVVLLDCHSCLQISLGATTWGIDYHHRNPAITTTILCVSIAANLTAALLISLGDKRTRKKEVVELLDRQQLTSDAIKHLQGKRARRNESGGGDWE